MTTTCPTHNRKLIRTHGGSQTCLSCRLITRKARYTTPLRMTNKSAEEVQKQNEYYRRRKVTG